MEIRIKVKNLIKKIKPGIYFTNEIESKTQLCITKNSNEGLNL